MTAGRLLRDAREASGLTRDALAAKTGVARAVIQAIETTPGRVAHARSGTLWALCKALGVDERQMVKWIEQSEEERKDG